MFDKIKSHLQENKKLYITGGVCIAVGVLTGVALTRTEKVKQTAKIRGDHNTLIQNTILVRRGHPGNVIRCNETGEVFASQNRAASALGLNASEVSKAVRGLTESVGGYTFANLGEAS